MSQYWEAQGRFCEGQGILRPQSAEKALYRVFSKGRIDVGPPKSLIFWTFPGVLGFFWPFNMGDFSFWYFWGIWLKKSWKFSSSKKARFQGWLKLAQFLLFEFLGFLGNQKICQFDPTLKFNIFWGWDYSSFFSIICPKSTRMKNRPYWMVKKSPKHQKKSKKWGI